MSSDKEEFDQEDRRRHETDTFINKHVGGWIASAIAGMAGWMGADMYMNVKLRAFETEVNNLVRKDIMTRTSAGLADGLGGIGGVSGAGHNSLHNAHYMNLIESGKHPLASNLYNWGGRSTVAMGIAVAAAVAGYYLYKMVAPKNDPGVVAVENAKSHASRLKSESKEKIVAEGKIPTEADIKQMEDNLETAKQLNQLGEAVNTGDEKKQKEVMANWEQKVASRKEAVEHTPSSSLSA